MDKETQQKIQEQKDKLKELQSKNLPDNVKESVNEKLKFINKPIRK